MCKNCGREYHTDKNFNWSCRVHRTPEYGGEMWWCCGKIGKDVPGCKFAKHESKEDDDEDDEEENLKSRAKLLKSIRCQCCKQLGHTIENCPRDPNIKTNEIPDLENQRIQTMKDYKKLFADTAVTTTHLLKKLSKVPKLKRLSDVEPDGLPSDQFFKKQNHQHADAFQRGSMIFDDYNYDSYNKYILIDPERDETD